MSVGNSAYTGVQRSYSFPHFWADAIPASTAGAWCPNMPCEQVDIQNDPNSTGNIVLGGLESLQTTGQGWVLEPGQSTGWIPIQNLGLIAHLDAADSHLNYKMVL